MPLYEYSCDDCQEDFEKLVRSLEAAREVECPSCGSKQVQKKISTFAARSKGGASFSSAGSSSSCAPTGT